MEEIKNFYMDEFKKSSVCTLDSEGISIDTISVKIAGNYKYITIDGDDIFLEIGFNNNEFNKFIKLVSRLKDE